MIKVKRTPKEDVIVCGKCSTESLFTNSVAPLLCKKCSMLFPDADEMTRPEASAKRAIYHLDELLYD